MEKLAIAGAYKNNCSFHCLAHYLFSQNENFLQTLFEENSFYTEMMFHFYKHYQLGEDYNFDDFMKLINKFNHPADREILFGEVFREFLKTLCEQDESFKIFDKKETLDGQLVSDNLFAQFCNKLGVDVIIFPDENEDSPFALPYETPQSYLTLKVFHTGKGGGHYNFTYDDSALNISHNQQFTEPNQYGQVRPLGHSILFDKTSIVGSKEQKEAIRDEVQSVYRQVTQSNRAGFR